MLVYRELVLMNPSLLVPVTVAPVTVAGGSSGPLRNTSGGTRRRAAAEPAKRRLSFACAEPSTGANKQPSKGKSVQFSQTALVLAQNPLPLTTFRYVKPTPELWCSITHSMRNLHDEERKDLVPYAEYVKGLQQAAVPAAPNDPFPRSAAWAGKEQINGVRNMLTAVAKLAQMDCKCAINDC
jgi:hypothetical protein